MAEEPPDGGGPQRDEDEGPGRSGRPGAIYSAIVGIVFIAVIVVAGISALQTDHGGVLGAAGEGDLPLAQFAIPDARGSLEGDANIAQDDCGASGIPCPEGERRTPACKVELEGAIRICDKFGKPLVLSFWFTRGGECEAQQDVFEEVAARYGDRVGFLGIDAGDDRETVQNLIRTHGWTHEIGLDHDGALSNLYRVGGCPTFVYAYPGGILQATSVGQLDADQLAKRVDDLLAASKRREETLR